MLYDGQIPHLPDATLFVHWGSYWRTHSDESLVVDTFGSPVQLIGRLAGWRGANRLVSGGVRGAK
ncbi:MAG: hypothetical protein ACRDYA_10000, partial [Egibacteraceae bacterium]